MWANRLWRATGSALCAPTQTLWAAKRRSMSTTSRRRMQVAARSLESSTNQLLSSISLGSLESFSPAIASTWLAAASNKLLQPNHVTPGSRKLVWWGCASCGHQYNRRIDLHVACGGACPQCNELPKRPNSASMRRRAITKGGAPETPAIAHRCRPDSSRAQLTAENANRIKKSVADGDYLRVKEQRNFLPMLAKTFSKEKHKIGAKERVYVSPKLDGIRCIVAYDAGSKRCLFFSRSGTIFECCDAKIEPALQHAFEMDPSLVLDGELYNDSENQKQLTVSTQRRNNTDVSKMFERMLRQPFRSSSNNTSSDVIPFEQLTSAIRTTREHRTPEISQLQQRLQYHVFDVLYAEVFSHSPSYQHRHAFLSKLLETLRRHNAQHIKSYDESVLSLVPSVPCTLKDVDAVLQTALAAGYEGVMLRRDGEDGASTSGGYAYGQRSSTLLKYKVMRDDEFIILRAVEGKGKWRGQLGAFVCRAKKGSKTFTVTPATTDEQKRRMWKNWKLYKGMALTVQFQQLTPDGIPRFPVGKCVRGAADGHDWL